MKKGKKKEKKVPIRLRFFNIFFFVFFLDLVI